jgi:hypothetical protein
VVLAGVAGRLEGALAELEVVVLAPSGERYEGEIASLFDNAAQQPGAGPYPAVAEVLVPAVLRRGRLLRGGAAIIALPDEAGSTGVTKDEAGR